MNITEMRIEDIEEVTKLAEQLGYPNTRQNIERRFKLMSQELASPAHALFVARNENKIIGWVQVNQEAATLLSDARAEVTALVVDESQRGKNVGRQLLAHAEKWAMSRGMKTVRVRSNVKRENAHRFYLREGYSIQKSWHLFVKDL